MGGGFKEGFTEKVHLKWILRGLTQMDWKRGWHLFHAMNDPGHKGDQSRRVQ